MPDNTIDSFETITYEQAVSILRRHADKDVMLITSPFPGMSIQIGGALFVQNEEPFAFAVVADERLSVTVMPFPNCIFQIPTGATDVDTLMCAFAGPEPGDEVMMWMVRFA
jgi:hypothetical protein